MRVSEIEAWALRIIDRVVKGQPTEDDRVELKAEWIDAKKAARRIAGHANASNGEPALWLIGVDEAGTVPGVDLDKFADWYQGVRVCFDELAPEIKRLNVPYGNVTVAALLIETDRAPFVVKCQERGAVGREVPYRHGTRCDAATRGQLVRVLAPMVAAPSIEIAHFRVDVAKSHQGSEWNHRWDVSARLFITQGQNQQTVFASHRCVVVVKYGNEEKAVHPIEFSRKYSESDQDSIALVGPEYFLIRGIKGLSGTTEPFFNHEEITAEFTATVPNLTSPVTTAVKLVAAPTSEPSLSAWEVDNIGRWNSPSGFVGIA